MKHSLKSKRRLQVPLTFLLINYKIMWRTSNRYSLGTFSATWFTDMKNSSAFRNQWVTLITNSFSGTIKFYASNQSEQIAPDLNSVASSNNEYSTVRSINLENWDIISWDTGLSLTTNSSVTRYEINDNNNTWVGVGITRTAGSVEIKLDFTDNQ